MSQSLPRPLLPVVLAKPPVVPRAKPAVLDDKTNRVGPAPLIPSTATTQSKAGTKHVNAPVPPPGKLTEDEALQALVDLIKREVAELSKKYKKKETYFLTKLHFTSKADRQSHAPNSWSAYLHKRAGDANEGK
jgi:hypothetical protein